MNELNIAITKHSRKILKVTKKLIAFVHNNKDYINVEDATLFNIDLFLEDKIETVISKTIKRKHTLKSDYDVKHKIVRGLMLDQLPSYWTDTMNAFLTFIN